MTYTLRWGWWRAWNERVGDGLGMSYKSKHSEFEYLLGVILDYFIYSFDG